MGTGRPIAIIYLSTPRMPDVIFQFGIIDDRMKVTKSGKGTALNDTKKRIRQQQNKTHTHKKKYFDIVFFLFSPSPPSNGEITPKHEVQTGKETHGIKDRKKEKGRGCGIPPSP